MQAKSAGIIQPSEYFHINIKPKKLFFSSIVAINKNWEMFGLALLKCLVARTERGLSILVQFVARYLSLPMT